MMKVDEKAVLVAHSSVDEMTTAATCAGINPNAQNESAYWAGVSKKISNWQLLITMMMATVAVAWT